MLHHHKVPRSLSRQLGRLIFHLLLLPIFAITTQCAPEADDQGQIRLLAALELETTPVFALALSPDDQYIAILTWKNYANTLHDQGIASLRVRIVNIRDSTTTRAIELPDKPGQQATYDVGFYWQDPTTLHIRIPDRHYTVDSRSGQYLYEDGTGLVPSPAQGKPDECSWSPHQLYCASIGEGTLRIRDTKGHIVRRQSVCDESYPVCDAYPLIWTSDDRLVFASEDRVWIWSRQ